MKRRLACTVLTVVAVSAQAYDLPADLRRRVDALVAEVASAPTGPETAAQRTAVLWEWANAASLEGGFIPKNLPLISVYLPHPRPGARVNPSHLAAVDDYVRQLSWLDDDPQAMGTIEVEGEARFEVDSWQTIRVKWTVGSLGLAEGGGILASRHMMGGYSAPQIQDPSADTYLFIESSSPELRFERETAPVWGPYGGFRAARAFPVFRLRGGSLESGDTVTLVYGDRSRGSRGFQVGTFSNDAVALPIQVDPGDGHFYELPLATYEVVGGAAERVHGFAPSIVPSSEPFTISLRTEDRYYNRATRGVPAYEVRMNGTVVAQVPADDALLELPVRLFEEGVYRFSFHSPDGLILGSANPVWVQDSPEILLFWGETHGHCGFAEGQGTPEGYFEFARDDARLDFVTLSEHDIWLTDGSWKVLNEVAKTFHEEGRFVVFPGYEWSAPRQRGGHHNIFFRRPGFDRIPVQEAWDLTMLYRGLRQHGYTDDALIIPHAHQAADWRLSDLDMQSLVEIMSSHGTFEWFGRRYLENGYRVGFVGASDNHLGHPGYAPAQQSPANRRSNIFQFGGLAAVRAEDNDTDSIFDALRARSVYATTGSQRIILDVTLNGGAMGTELPESRERRIEGRAIGTDSIRRVDLIKNGEVVGSKSFDLSRRGSDKELTLVTLRFFSDSVVFYRDNPRGHRTWNGTVVVEGATLKGASLLGTVSPTSDVVEVEGSRLRFGLATRGAPRVIQLKLQGASAETNFRFELEATREMGTAPTQVRTPQVFEAASFTLRMPTDDSLQRQLLQIDEWQDSVTVEAGGSRAPDNGADVAFVFTDEGDPGDWYFVRVEQVDGHLAWSSPWWVGGEQPR